MTECNHYHQNGQNPDWPITVTESGFRDNDWRDMIYLSVADLDSYAPSDQTKTVISIASDQDVEILHPWLSDITAIELYFDTAHDGRGFSQARRLIEMGFQGQIRGAGSLHVDQFPHAIQCGISALNLTHEAALRMPEEYWIKTAAPLKYRQTYQNRLMPARSSGT